jgi:hypothetical protein
MSCNCCWFIQPDTAISRNRNGSRDFVMRKVTLSPAAHGHVGDPLQIEADRFFGHYAIEHRLFSEISKNWAGEPLDSYQKILRFIRSTKTHTGLSVTAHLDRRNYPTGTQPTPEELQALRIRPHEILPKWNYTISPNL